MDLEIFDKLILEPCLVTTRKRLIIIYGLGCGQSQKGWAKEKLTSLKVKSKHFLRLAFVRIKMIDVNRDTVSKLK